MDPEISEIVTVTRFYETRDSRLAAFLASQGCRLLREMCLVSDYRDSPNAPRGSPIAILRFEESAELYRLAAQYNDPDIINTQPDSQVAAVRAWQRWHRYFVDEIKKAQVQHIVKDGQKVFFIPDGYRPGK